MIQLPDNEQSAASASFSIGQTFPTAYPPEAALWANGNGAFIEACGNGTYAIRQVPEPTAEELQTTKRAERDALLAATDWQVLRLLEQQMEWGEADGGSVAQQARGQSPRSAPTGLGAYRHYLRDFPQQPGNWWTLPIVNYEDWQEVSTVTDCV